MNFLEHVAKVRVLAPAGLAVPRGVACETPQQAFDAFATLGPCMIKAQVPTGKRGKAGGIKPAQTAEQAREVAECILGMTIDGHRVGSVLLEERADIKREFYACVLNDTLNRCPMVLFSIEGGMDIEDVAASRPDAIKRHLVDPVIGFDIQAACTLIAGLDLSGAEDAVARMLAALLRISGTIRPPGVWVAMPRCTAA